MSERTPYYCQNPECSQQIPPAKWKYKPKHCNHDCLQRHAALQRGKCKRPGCENYLPPHRHVYCSGACYKLVVVVPRVKCKRPGCENLASHNAHAVYCSLACRDACVDIREIGKKGRAVQTAYKAATGHVPKHAKRSAAVSRNNRIAPPRRKMRRTDTAYGLEIIFEPEGNGYRAYVPSVAGIIARGKTKKATMIEIKKMLRESGEVKSWQTK